MGLCEKLNNRRRREQNKKQRVQPSHETSSVTTKHAEGDNANHQSKKNHLVTSAPLIPNFSSSMLNTVEQYTTRITHKSDEIRKMIIRVTKHTERKTKKPTKYFSSQTAKDPKHLQSNTQ
jgi:hypothetical protein